jgi:transmembrane sensor
MNNTPIRPHLRAQIREEAAEWLVTFSEGTAEPSAREEFNAWLRVSPEHVRAYLRVSAFWEAADRIGLGTNGDIDELVRRAQQENNIVPLQPPATPTASAPTVLRRTVPLLAVAASMAILSVALTWWYLADPTYATATGEQRTVTLTDGSTVELNARSRLRLHFSKRERAIDLLEGQAIFRVAHDATRPFIVRSDRTSVKAVGTQFDVDRKQSGVVVTVIEGKVAVAQNAELLALDEPAKDHNDSISVLLAEGQQLVAQTDRHVIVRPIDPAKVTAWQEGLLVFDSAPLSEVAEEFNRHNLKSLVIDDPQVRALRISGVFPATGSDRIMEFLRERFGITAHETKDSIVIDRR